ncbi:MAG: rhomboid family intramembrane serine protease [Desulfobacteraceae bacterium]
MTVFYNNEKVNIFLNHLTQKQADLAVLVLASQGIKAEAEENNGFFDLHLDEEKTAAACTILETYYDENTKQGSDIGQTPLPRLKKITPLLMAAVISIIHVGCVYTGFHSRAVIMFGSSGLYILQGEYYRIFTALLLHADMEHLAGNIAGILIFGSPVCTLTGNLRGLLLLAGAGSAGNLINALMYKTARLSIGASTAVMGGAGILTVLQIKRKASLKGLKPAVFLPLAAGAALVGMLSGGENTDVSAHIFGFISGIGIGFFCDPTP